MSGAGAAGTAILKLLLKAGATDVVVADQFGVLHRDREDIASGRAPGPGVVGRAHQPPRRDRHAQGRDRRAPTCSSGVSAPGILTGDDIATMNDGAIVFAMANPEPEVDPIAAAQHAAVVATGRSDFANQINNVLVFPGVFRGLLDAASTSIDEDVMLAAAKALSEVVHPEELNAAYIIPSVFHPDVSKVVAAAVKAAVLGTTPEQVPTTADAPEDQARSFTVGSADPAGPGRRTSPAAVVFAVTARRAPGRALLAAGRHRWARSRGATRSAHVLLFLAPTVAGLLAGVRPAYLVALLALHAPVSELLQHYLLPHRSGDAWDAVADLGGVVLGVTSVVVGRALRR